MKIILSRKGMDSAFGGYPSIILPNNEYISFPIPGDLDEIKYSDVQTFNGKRMTDVMSHFMKRIFYYQWEEFGSNTHCHLDPDIIDSALPRMEGWRGCFGQADAAQTVLEKNGVSEGDLFLFFGWFRKCIMKEEKIYLEKGSDMQCIYGYMQIDNILYTSEGETIPDWLQYHPHALKRRVGRKSNCIYIAKRNLSWDSRKKGYGMLTYSDITRLTKPGYSRSKWNLPEFLRGKSITYHSDNSWKETYFQSACRGQEFVIEENPEVEKWAKMIIDLSVKNNL